MDLNVRFFTIRMRCAMETEEEQVNWDSIKRGAENLLKEMKTKGVTEYGAQLFYFTASHIKQLKNGPELMEGALNLFEEAMKSDKTDEKTLSEVLIAVGRIAEAQPNLAKRCFDAVNNCMKSGKNTAYLLPCYCSAYADIALGNSSLQKSCLEEMDKCLISEKHDADSLEHTYRHYGLLLVNHKGPEENRMEVMKSLVEAFEKAVKSDKNDESSRRYAAYALSFSAGYYPQFAEKCLDIVRECSDKDSGYSTKHDDFDIFYKSFGEIAACSPKLAEPCLDMIRKRMKKNDPRDNYVLLTISDSVRRILEAEPKLAEPCLDILEECAARDDGQDSRLLASILKGVGTIVEAEPKLVDRCLNVTALCSERPGSIRDRLDKCQERLGRKISGTQGRDHSVNTRQNMPTGRDL